MSKKNGTKTKNNFASKLTGGARTRVSALTEVDKNIFKIMHAKITDDLCHYGYEILEGVGLGDPCSIKGTNLIKDEMRTAFANLRPHLAFIDDVFKYQGVQVDEIDQMHAHELTQLFVITGFKIKGSEENESVTLIGNKYLSSGSRMELESPAIAMDNLSSYKWAPQLKQAMDEARVEVALYKEGFYTPVKSEEDEEEENPKQMKIETAAVSTNGAADDDFENQ